MKRDYANNVYINTKKMRRDINLFLAFLHLCKFINWCTRGRFERWNIKNRYLEKVSDNFFSKRSLKWNK